MHQHSHGHDHHHSHEHHAEKNSVFKFAVAINIAIVAIEVIYGFLSHSISLVADAGHNLTDVLGLLLAWGANVLAARPPTKRRTYGYRRTTILASLTNAIVLLVVTGAILTEAVNRLMHPLRVEGTTVSWVAGIAIVLNGIAAWLFTRGHSHDLNVRGAYLHMLSDAVVSAGVVVSGLLIYFTGANWIDPALSVVISLVIAAGTWSLLRESFNLASDAVPKFVNQHQIESFLRSQPGVADMHDLHIWGMSTTDAVLTAHLIMPEVGPSDDFLFCLSRDLKNDFGIEHTTIQIERGTGADCHLAPDHVV